MRYPDRSRPAEKVAEHHAAGEGITRIPYPIGIRTVTLLRREQLTERMIRLTVGGPGLDGMHTYQADDHVKIVFPNEAGVLRIPTPNEHDMLDWPKDCGPERSYTIRRYDAQARELDLDFVLHDGGLASEWARTAAIGSDVALAGPPGAKAFAHTYDYYVLVADSTALPAVGRWLTENPDADARVVAVVEDPVHQQYPLALGARPDVVWLNHHDDPDELIAAVEAALGEGSGFLFAAGEADFIKPLRRWSKGRIPSVITGYWKRGVVAYDHD